VSFSRVEKKKTSIPSETATTQNLQKAFLENGHTAVKLENNVKMMQVGNKRCYIATEENFQIYKE